MSDILRRRWRADIAGLRALAVIPVVAYHFFPGIIPNGFLGVDIFFVISGYLISGIIFRGLKNSSFSWTDFYSKRVKRIFPNLIVVLIFSLVVGWFFLTATEYKHLALSVGGSAFFFENIRVLGNLNYFDPSVTHRPLLHMWSLSVEEQFYIVFPLLCMFLWKIKRSASLLGGAVVVIALLSFVACVLTEDKSYAFYFPLTRFWELALGICLAWQEEFRTIQMPFSLSNIFSLAGFCLIVLAFWFPISLGGTPGWLNLISVAGTIMIIAAGNDARVNKTILSCRVMVFVGAISYSLYLWHWVFYSFLNIIYPEYTFGMALSVLIASFFVSVVFFYALEEPVRKVSKEQSKKVVTTLLILMAIVFMANLIIRHEKGFVFRKINTISQEITNRTEKNFWKLKFVSTTLNGVPIEVSSLKTPPDILFVGDSHSQQYNLRVEKLAEGTGAVVAFYQHGGTFLLPNVQCSKECTRKNRQLLDVLREPSIKKVVIGEFWGSYKDSKIRNYVYLDPFSGKKTHLSDGGFEMALRNLRKVILSYPEKEFYVILDAPWDTGSYNILRHFNRLSPKAFGKEYWVPYPEEDRWKQVNDIVENELRDVVKFIRPEKYVCRDGMCDLMRYADENHLHPLYLKDNAIWIDPIFR